MFMLPCVLAKHGISKTSNTFYPKKTYCQRRQMCSRFQQQLDMVSTRILIPFYHHPLPTMEGNEAKKHFIKHQCSANTSSQVPWLTTMHSCWFGLHHTVQMTGVEVVHSYCNTLLITQRHYNSFKALHFHCLIELQAIIPGSCATNHFYVQIYTTNIILCCRTFI